MNLNATLVFQMLVFFILAWFTMKFVWPPLMKSIEERRLKIAEGLASAEKGKAELVQAEARIGQIEAAAKSDNQARLAQAEKQAVALIEQARKDAEAERARILEQARQEAQQEAQRAREGLRDAVAQLAVKGAEEILKREVNAQVHAELLGQLKAQL
ncbi:F0F1 ATP synthase subunit B [Pigmentiphaga sp.]|uniref:F0F1 ATP synthase subunit B n=1 Tax=Pigmentiphaga sp. TaxID=1977564 RepID=UPI0012C44295|nr:F0F1 ATP synthase subunit B [Pigmentiphaga sp.]MPS25470.1 F0F1 ATP synthase subunit B [Alcaligenaceae bacterium SAGV5]MPS54084.1 F0F1 ATP synthase subunit B [Alcaligenaceae bacterium SAGV3]MPT58783.1 F0F1 ATP synthase subunit B [Alcaligenaceae bacterium]